MADSIVLYEDPGYGGRRVVGIQNAIQNLTIEPVNFPNGASSMAIGADAGRWKVFTEINYNGNHVCLEPGVQCPNPEEMGLPGPVFSMHPANE